MNETSLTATAYPHRYCIPSGTEDMTHRYCISSPVLRIWLTGTENMTHGYCISSRVLRIWLGYDSRVLMIWLTGTAYSLYRVRFGLLQWGEPELKPNSSCGVDLKLSGHGYCLNFWLIFFEWVKMSVDQTIPRSCYDQVEMRLQDNTLDNLSVPQSNWKSAFNNHNLWTNALHKPMVYELWSLTLCHKRKPDLNASWSFFYLCIPSASQSLEFQLFHRVSVKGFPKRK